MRKFAAVLLAVLVSGTAGSSAWAEGFYGAFDAGQLKASDACVFSAARGTSGCKDSANAFRLSGGYQFTPNLGAEVGVGVGLRSTLGTTGGTEVGGWRLASLIQASATGTLPLGDAFSLTGRVGIARTSLEVLPGPNTITATTLKPVFGIGAQYALTKSVAVRAQFEDFGTVGDANTTGVTKLTLLSAGVVYAF
jgi:OmpA-OmpF porin, OOP family